MEWLESARAYWNKNWARARVEIYKPGAQGTPGDTGTTKRWAWEVISYATPVVMGSSNTLAEARADVVTAALRLAEHLEAEARAIRETFK